MAKILIMVGASDAVLLLRSNGSDLDLRANVLKIALTVGPERSLESISEFEIECSNPSPAMLNASQQNSGFYSKITTFPVPAPTTASNIDPIVYHAALQLGSSCPTCLSGTLAMKKLKSGTNISRAFIGCTQFPKCRFFEWVH